MCRTRGRRTRERAILVLWQGVVAFQVAEATCQDNDVELMRRFQLSCEEASVMQLCRSTEAQRACIDDDRSLHMYAASVSNCSFATTMDACSRDPVVARWCPRACGSCPTTPERGDSVAATRRFCPVTCGLCVGHRAEDCIGAFGSWSTCSAECFRVRRFAVTRAAWLHGRQCDHVDGEQEYADCCGVETRWRVVAASALPGAWEVLQVKFYEEIGTSSDSIASASPSRCAGPPVVVTTHRGVRPGVEHETLSTSDGFLADDPAFVESSTCLGCCTPADVGPIASGSMPSPYGCESALMRQPSPASKPMWRSSCNPCESGQAWLGFRKSGDPAKVRCVELNQVAHDPVTGLADRGPRKIRVERWTGDSWELRAESAGTLTDHVTIRVEAGGAPFDSAWQLVQLVVVIAAILFVAVRLYGRNLVTRNTQADDELEDGVNIRGGYCEDTLEASECSRLLAEPLETVKSP